MNDAHYTSLTDRGILSGSGIDSLAFLQGIVTNDVAKVSSSQVVYSAILTPQGKYLSDFFIVKSDAGFLLDCPANQLNELSKIITGKKIFNNKDELDSSMINYLNLFKEKNLSQSYSEKFELKFVNEEFKVKNYDYYYSKSIARASKTMFECRSEEINLKATGTEG